MLQMVKLRLIKAASGAELAFEPRSPSFPDQLLPGQYLVFTWVPFEDADLSDGLTSYSSWSDSVRGAKERGSGGHTKTSKGNWLLKRAARPREEEDAKAAAVVYPLL